MGIRSSGNARAKMLSRRRAGTDEDVESCDCRTGTGDDASIGLVPKIWPSSVSGWAKSGVEKFKFYMSVWSRYGKFWIFSSSRLDSTVSKAAVASLESSVRHLGPHFRTCCPEV